MSACSSPAQPPETSNASTRRSPDGVRDALELFTATGQSDVVRLRGIEPPEYRLRVGEWRVRFTRDPPTPTITVLRRLPRRRAYRD